MADVAITVDGLTKRYRGHTAVENMSFTVRGGAITGIFGLNGAGKTTALKVISGLARASAGQVLWGGHDTPAGTRGRLGVFIEPCGAHPGRSARAHLRSLAAMAGLPRARVAEVLALVGLDQVSPRRVGRYSLGMRQRLGLAAALLTDPDILVLDEPMNGLDPRGIRWLRTLLREQADSGRTVMLSSHSLTETERLVDDVIVIHQGRVVHQGPIGPMTDRGATLEEIFLGLTDADPTDTDPTDTDPTDTDPTAAGPTGGEDA
ncbi:ATP-binding cassette domain-containing protein [Frankia sp. CNm7]|nr:ATP-binding cassette domain-containing protein [Frankia nepalensis]MBL7514926.1 ATP-binding cassette domain-containing protein [Frankia nepalensis]MBL7522079.1 ATP-binding cassette domain-containing protein [Frankia nepalensis]